MNLFLHNPSCSNPDQVMNQWDTCFLDMKVIKTTTKIAPVHQHTYHTLVPLCHLCVLYSDEQNSTPTNSVNRKKKVASFNIQQFKFNRHTHHHQQHIKFTKTFFQFFARTCINTCIPPPTPPSLFKKSSPVQTKQQKEQTASSQHPNLPQLDEILLFYKLQGQHPSSH